jgi:hypothetical protein
LYDLKNSQTGRNAETEERRFDSQRESALQRIEMFLKDLGEAKLLSPEQKTEMLSCLLIARNDARLDRNHPETPPLEVRGSSAYGWLNKEQSFDGNWCEGIVFTAPRQRRVP